MGKEGEGPVGRGDYKASGSPSTPCRSARQGFSPTPGRPGPQRSKAEKRENRGRAEIESKSFISEQFLPLK